MKNNILTIAMTGVMVATGLTAFGQESPKAASARKEVSEAKKNLTEAKKDSAADFQKFKKDAEMKISENHKKIAELKAKKSSDTKEVKEKYDKKVLALEEKNNALNKRIKNCNDTKTDMWTTFKHDFVRDMDALGHDIKSI